MTNYEILKEYEEHQTPVLSYEKYENIIIENTSLKQIRDELDCAITQLREDKIDLEEENAQLKELLKWCAKIMIEPAVYIGTLEEKERYINNLHKKQQLLYKIDEVLK